LLVVREGIGPSEFAPPLDAATHGRSLAGRTRRGSDVRFPARARSITCAPASERVGQRMSLDVQRTDRGESTRKSMRVTSGSKPRRG
jgi:hypothetical protein